MQLRIVHTTGFEYAGKAAASFNEARLTPQTRPGQIVVHTRLEVHPTPWTYTYRDYWGSQVTAFEVLDPHTSLTVTATATVHTDRAPAGDPVLSWDEVRSPEVKDLHTEFLTLPERVAPPEDLVELARGIAESSPSPSEAERCLERLQSSGTRAGFQNEAQRLLGRTRAELEYRSLSDFVAELPNEMERLQRTCALATDAISRRYFAGAEATEWHGVRA